MHAAFDELGAILNERFPFDEPLQLAYGKVQRRWSMIEGMVPALRVQRRRAAADSFISLAATSAAGNEYARVTVRQVEEWITANHPDAARDPATIRASLIRLQRLQPNTRGRPRKTAAPK